MTGTPPVRRSALESVHRALGGQWPQAYGDVDAERRTIIDGIGVAEPGLYDKWLVRAPGVLVACRSAGLEGRPGRVTPAPPGGINLWAIADDEVWLVAYAPTSDGSPASPVDFGPVVETLRAAGGHATDVSSGWSILRLLGLRVRDLLEELVSEDLSAEVVPDQAILQVPLAGCRVILARRDRDAIPGFTLLVARDEAHYLWDVFSHLGEAHGLKPVGATALLSTGGTTVAAGAAR